MGDGKKYEVFLCAVFATAVDDVGMAGLWDDDAHLVRAAKVIMARVYRGTERRVDGRESWKVRRERLGDVEELGSNRIDAAT